MATDIFTQHFINRDKWVSVCHLIGIVDAQLIQHNLQYPNKHFDSEKGTVACCAVSIAPRSYTANLAASMAASAGAYDVSGSTNIATVAHSTARASLLATFQWFDPTPTFAAGAMP